MQESQSPCTFFFSSEISCNSDQQSSMKILNGRAICSPHSCAYMENLKQWKINRIKRAGDSTHPDAIPLHCLFLVPPGYSTLQTPVFQLCPSSPSCLSTICRRVLYHSEDQSWGGSRVLTLTLGIFSVWKVILLQAWHGPLFSPSPSHFMTWERILNSNYIEIYMAIVKVKLNYSTSLTGILMF